MEDLEGDSTVKDDLDGDADSDAQSDSTIRDAEYYRTIREGKRPVARNGTVSTQENGVETVAKESAEAPQPPSLVTPPTPAPPVVSSQPRTLVQASMQSARPLWTWC